jgi:hypothetical protein
MPAPSSGLIENLAKGALASAGMRGQNIPDLASALGEIIAQALTLFAAQAMIAPGALAVADPTTGSGSTAGPGMLLPPPAGGPEQSQLEPIALGMLAQKQINGAQRGALAKVIAQATAQAILLFTSMVQMGPGIAIAGFVTTAPGMLIGAAPAKPMLAPIILSFAQAAGLRGKNVPELADAIAETLAGALSLFLNMVQVAPGILATPAATALPGRLC